MAIQHSPFRRRVPRVAGGVSIAASVVILSLLGVTRNRVIVAGAVVLCVRFILISELIAVRRRPSASFLGGVFQFSYREAGF